MSAAGATPRPTRPGIDPWSIPLDAIDVSNPELYAADAWQPFFRRLRAEAPVHYCAESSFGPYWSVTRYADIRRVDMDHRVFSSEPTIIIGDPPKNFVVHPGFIAMDPPKHDIQRAVVQPAVASASLARLEPLIRARAGAILDALPVGESFDWVERVSIELTTQMLATLFDFPWEERHKLTQWSDMATSSPRQTAGSGVSDAEWKASMLECLEYFTRLWHERGARPPGDTPDLVTLLAQHPATRDMEPLEFLGNLILLIVGGNDTTRNSISGGVLALAGQPQTWAWLHAEPARVPGMVAEIIRWQTPLAHMRRTAREDTELCGQRIRRGDKVVMWYLSGNRDESVFPCADAFVPDRPNARHHIGFGFGVHRCMGSRLAEMQLRIVWEEILRRFRRIEVTGAAVRVRSSFVHGYEHLPVQVWPL